MTHMIMIRHHCYFFFFLLLLLLLLLLLTPYPDFNMYNVVFIL